MLVVLAATTGATSAVSREVVGGHVAAALVAVLITAGMVGFALRAPGRLLRRSLAAGAIGGGGLGGAVLVVFFLMVALGPTVEGTGLALLAVLVFSVSSAAVGVGLGVILGATGASPGPRFVAVDPAACNAALGQRAASDSAPFRANALATPGARIDAGARRARAILTRRSGAAAATALIAGLISIATVTAPDPAPPGPTPPSPIAAARVEALPHRLALDGPAQDLAMYGNAACAVLSRGGAYCWGKNNGRFPRSPAEVDTPTRVREAPFVHTIALGLGHACAIDDGGTVDCWGKGDLGQLGNGTVEDSTSPERVRIIRRRGAHSPRACSTLPSASAKSASSWVSTTSSRGRTPQRATTGKLVMSGSAVATASGR